MPDNNKCKTTCTAFKQAEKREEMRAKNSKKSDSFVFINVIL